MRPYNRRRPRSIGMYRHGILLRIKRLLALNRAAQLLVSLSRWNSSNPSHSYSLSQFLLVSLGTIQHDPTPPHNTFILKPLILVPPPVLPRLIPNVTHS